MFEGEAVDTLHGFDDMASTMWESVVGKALLVACHIGRASASTAPRKLSGMCVGFQNVHRHTEQLDQLVADRSDVEEGCL